MLMEHCMEIHTVQLSIARYHYLILLENGDGPLWLSALQLMINVKLCVCGTLPGHFDLAG